MSNCAYVYTSVIFPFARYITRGNGEQRYKGRTQRSRAAERRNERARSQKLEKRKREVENRLCSLSQIHPFYVRRGGSSSNQRKGASKTKAGSVARCRLRRRRRRGTVSFFHCAAVVPMQGRKEKHTSRSVGRSVRRTGYNSLFRSLSLTHFLHALSGRNSSRPKKEKASAYKMKRGSVRSFGEEEGRNVQKTFKKRERERERLNEVKAM